MKAVSKAVHFCCAAKESLLKFMRVLVGLGCFRKVLVEKPADSSQAGGGDTMNALNQRQKCASKGLSN
jgi:hypothetical protein